MQNVESFRKNMTSSIVSDPMIQALLEYSQKLENRICWLERKTFGRSSEKYIDPRQGSLFNEIESCLDDPDNAVSDDDKEENEDIDVPGHRRRKRRAQIELPESLPREVVIHDVAESDRHCSCCQGLMVEISEDKVEKLNVVPAKITVTTHVYKKYACPNKSCDQAPKQAAREASAIPKIKATEDTLAFIAVQKFLFSLPLYRLEYFFRDLGISLSRYVMSLWMIKLADILKPIYLTLEETLLARNYLHIDETTLQVLKEPGRAATTKSFVWVRTGGINCQGPPIVLYHYSPNRSADTARKLLGDFRGYLQSDDYVAYSSVTHGRAETTHVLCWDHTRRYFFEAFQQISKENRANTTADRVLKLIGKLYKIEQRATALSTAERLALRQQESLPILEKIKVLCSEKRPKLGDKTPTAKAIDYMFDNWEKLQIFTRDGLVNISNNPAEQRVRPFAVGRKNWLFACTQSGAEASCIIYSVLETAKMNGLSPIEYLTKTIKGLAKVSTTEDLVELLPLKKPLVH